MTVLERRPKAGGLNEYGIASYKATNGFAQAEVEWLLSIGGIEVRTGVELGRDVAGQFQVLLLVLSHRHAVRVIQKNVRRHQHRIRKEPVRSCDSLGHLVLVAVTSFQKPHGGDGGKIPSQLVHLRNCTLPKNDRPFWIHTTSQEIEKGFFHQPLQLTHLTSTC